MHTLCSSMSSELIIELEYEILMQRRPNPILVNYFSGLVLLSIIAYLSARI